MPKSTTRERVQSELISLLRDSREEMQMSMTQLAQKSGLSLAMISLVERELRKPTLDSLLRIAEALDVDLAALLRRATIAAKRSGKA